MGMGHMGVIVEGAEAAEVHIVVVVPQGAA